MNDYVKITYQSDPIGKERIVLYLTTFDIEKYNNDIKLKEVKAIEVMRIDNMKDHLDFVEAELNRWVKNFYEPYINEVKQLLKERTLYQIRNVYDDVKNVSNIDKLTCNIVRGNVSNCDVIYCNEIQGNIHNCDKIIYKGEK